MINNRSYISSIKSSEQSKECLKRRLILVDFIAEWHICVKNGDNISPSSGSNI